VNSKKTKRRYKGYFWTTNGFVFLNL